MNIVRLEAITHRYGKLAALDGVTLAIPAGATVALLGPDGVGKSTLLGLIAGVRKPQAGRIEVLGGDIAAAGHRRRVQPRIAYMPQGLGRNLYPTLSVRENADFFGRLFGLPAPEREARLAELLAATGLAPFAERAAGKLSGGMKQKLGLCCALIHAPELLILDEPTTGVDPLSRRQFWELLTRIRARTPGLSVLVATAYMEEAERFERLVLMDSGRVLATGTPAELKARTGTDSLEHAFVAALPAERRAGHARLAIPPRPAEHAELALEAEGLTRRFGDFTAVDQVSFRIERGEIFGFLGSNGCGKTTTMKMLTGLLPADAGEARLFGRPVDPHDLRTRLRIGYMSQAFSLYRELSVAQNLELHARLLQLPPARVAPRIAELVERFGLDSVFGMQADALPLGLKQRLSLACAVIHAPEVLILDEPTSGVDPIARDRFWELLIELSRRQGVTIFITTHFMNEAARCDRISLMHAGRVLAQDAPAHLVADSGTADLEQAFIHYLEQAEPASPAAGSAVGEAPALPPHPNPLPQGEREQTHRLFSLGRLLSFAHREAIELLRDPIRIAFALVGTLLLMLVMGYGISLDVEGLRYAVLDQDRTPASRDYLDAFAGSRQFAQAPPLASRTELERRLASGELAFAIEIPPGFGRELKGGRAPAVGFFVDGAMPFRAETARGQIEGAHRHYLAGLGDAAPAAAPATIEARFRYNQDFRSINAIAPGVIALLLLVIPATLTALGVVREKEYGSITNLHASPATRLEFLLGKQLPYVAVGLLNFALLVLLTLLLFGVPLKGSLAGLAVGALLYVLAATSWGLLISTITRTQIAALFGAFILTLMPSINFSGLLTPVSSLSGDGAVMAFGFPASYFLELSVGAFTKALTWHELAHNYLWLALFTAVYLALSLCLLGTRER